MELDSALLAARESAREHAADLRSRALAVDAHPEDMRPHLDSPAYQAIQRGYFPTGYALGDTFTRMSYLEETVWLTELARGDAGALLACPGPALAGLAVNLLGSPEQVERFYSTIEDGRTWAFCAVTEPMAGSDATNMQTELRPDGAGGFLLHGTKRYIGNGERGSIGVVFARTGSSPLSIRAALVDLPATGADRFALDMIGLRGARLSQLDFHGVPVSSSSLLGNHLSPMRRGMWGAMQMFNAARLQIGAMAVGTAFAVHDYVAGERSAFPAWQRAELDGTRAHVEAARRLLYRAGADVDADPEHSQLAAQAKLTAVRLAVRVTTRLPRFLGPGALVDHPLLEKWWRDTRAFEFMEGTSSIQLLTIARQHLRAAQGRS